MVSVILRKDTKKVKLNKIPLKELEMYFKQVVTGLLLHFNVVLHIVSDAELIILGDNCVPIYSIDYSDALVG